MKSPAFEIRAPLEADIPMLKPIFKRWILDRETREPDTVLADYVESCILSSIAGENSEKYLVAAEDESVLGIMGIQPPGLKMLRYRTTRNPREIITAMVSDETRSQGVGKALLAGLTDIALQDGSRELLVNSSDLYRRTGWPFWTSQFGEPIAVAQDIYGPGHDAMVWRKRIP